MDLNHKSLSDVRPWVCFMYIRPKSLDGNIFYVHNAYWLYQYDHSSSAIETLNSFASGKGLPPRPPHSPLPFGKIVISTQ